MSEFYNVTFDLYSYRNLQPIESWNEDIKNLKKKINITMRRDDMLIDKKEYIELFNKTYDDDRCYIGIFKSDIYKRNILGRSFLNRYYTIFDATLP